MSELFLRGGFPDFTPFRVHPRDSFPECLSTY